MQCGVYPGSCCAGNELGEDVEPEEEPAADDGPKRLSIPPIGSGDPNNTRPERTEPFKFVYTDRVSTNSKSGAAKPNPVYNAKPLSAKEFEQGNRDFMLQAVDHYRSTNSDKDSSLVDKTATLLQKIIDESKGGDLKQFRDALEPLLLEPAIARDPFFQYLAGTVLMETDETVAAGLLFNGSIVDHQKWDYPSRYVVPVFNARLKNGLDLRANRDGYEAHVDAIVGWLQYDFSGTPDEQCFCWAILDESIKLLAKEDQLDQVKKIIDKNSDQQFISPWLAEMIQAQYHCQLAMADNDVEANLNQSKQHLQAALKINPAFTAAQTDLEVVEKRLSAL